MTVLTALKPGKAVSPKPLNRQPYTVSITRRLSSILFYFLGSWVPSILQRTLKRIRFFVRGLLKSLDHEPRPSKH